MEEMYIPKQDLLRIQQVIKSFQADKTDEEIFYHLCFCIMVPQAKFSSATQSVTRLKEKDFYNKSLPINELEQITKLCRFFRRKAKYLQQMRQQWQDIIDLVRDRNILPIEKRTLLKDKIKGIGMKEASHFLRNMGYTGLAIIDSHILRFMNAETPTNVSQYLKLEQKFDDFAKFLGYDLTTLDCYIWKRQSKTAYEDYAY